MARRSLVPIILSAKHRIEFVILLNQIVVSSCGLGGNHKIFTNMYKKSEFQCINEMSILFSLFPIMKVGMLSLQCTPQVLIPQIGSVYFLKDLLLGGSHKLLHVVMLPFLWNNYWHVLMCALVGELQKSSFFGQESVMCGAENDIVTGQELAQNMVNILSIYNYWMY